MAYVEPFLENVNDPMVIYIGFAVFAVIMTAAILLMLRLNWEKILGRFAPWTVEKDDEN
jgi:hypothetical protein